MHIPNKLFKINSGSKFDYDFSYINSHVWAWGMQCVAYFEIIIIVIGSAFNKISNRKATQMKFAVSAYTAMMTFYNIVF